MRTPLDLAATRIQRRERELVDHPARTRRVLLRGAASFVVVLVAWVYFIAGDGGWLRLVLQVVLGWILGTSVMRNAYRALAYRNGWLDGRLAMLASYAESGRRGLTVREWLEAEHERDLVVLNPQPEQRPAASRPDGSHDDL